MNEDYAPRVVDDFLSFKDVEALGYARSSDSQQIAQHFVREWNLVRLQSGTRDQQPSSQSLLESVAGVARARLRRLQQNEVEISKKDCTKDGQLPENRAKFPGTHAKSVSADLHHAPMRRLSIFFRQNERCAHHPF
jgi:hypothetical protein